MEQTDSIEIHTFSYMAIAFVAATDELSKITGENPVMMRRRLMLEARQFFHNMTSENLEAFLQETYSMPLNSELKT